ncbi:MAG: FGGY family carbohydrate kinase [Actinomycetota bacterium]
MTFLLGLDIGTSGGRALICHDDGRVAASASRSWHYRIDAHGFPELDPHTILASLASASREAIRACVARPDAFAAIGVTSQRTGVILIDDNGAVVHAGPNSDPRGLKFGLAQEKEHGNLIYEKAGRLPAFLFLPARLAWLREFRPELFDRVKHALSFSDWVSFHLSGEIATERTQASETLCYDIASASYSDELCKALGVDQAILPTIKELGPVGWTQEASAHDFGVAAGIPVVHAGADTQCAGIGSGASELGSISISAGTTMPVQQLVAQPVLDPERRLWTSPHQLNDRYVLDANCGESGPAVDWLLSLLERDYGWLDKAAASAPAGSGGVLHVDTAPSNMGNFPMIRSGGFSYPVPVMALGRSREDLARATLEGIAFAARHAIDWLREVSGVEPPDVHLCGGLAASRTFASIVAGVLGREVRRSMNPATALGACIVAAGAVGAHATLSEAIDVMHDAGEQVLAESSEAYESIYPTWLETSARHEQSIMRVKDFQ